MKQSAASIKKRRLDWESECRRSGFGVVIGVDEAGRGPLAGPVVAGAAAVLDFNASGESFGYLLENVADSKKLSGPKRREVYDVLIASKNIVWGCGRVGPKIIDKINILEATKVAMSLAIACLVAKLPPSHGAIFCLLDGNFQIGVEYPQESIIKGDQKIFSISAASIIAKVSRDRMMERLDKKYPDYGFARHKGYPTREHVNCLARLGLLPEHRKSFGPCAGLLGKAIIK